MADALAQLKSRFPDECAAAERLAREQAARIKALEQFPITSSRTSARLESNRAEPENALANYAQNQRAHVEQTISTTGLRQIAAAFADRSLTPPTLLATLLERIDRVDPLLNSFVALDRVGARLAADASAIRWANGTALGPLDGIPVGIKDVIDVAGLPTRCHSRVTSATPATRDAAVVAQLRQQGAVILGKLATHEYAIGGPTFDLPFPPARNPWNRDHHPGGSSSGAGAAVAAGLVPLAIGTDTAGSVRNPASACGAVGLKPGRDLLSTEGVVPLAQSLDHVGLLTRSVDDMAVAAPALGIQLTEQSIGRVGYVRHFHTRDMIATAETAAALDRVAAVLGAMEIALPPLGDFALVNRIILQCEGFAAHRWALRERPADLSRVTRTALLPGAFTSPKTLATAFRWKDELTTSVEQAFEHVDLLLTASSMEPACRIDDLQEIARTYMLQARTPFNVTGHPALAMPTRLSSDGLPLSLQLAGRMGDEGRLLAAARLWEQAMGGPLSPPTM